jgi:hypothetical protein
LHLAGDFALLKDRAQAIFLLFIKILRTLSFDLSPNAHTHCFGLSAAFPPRRATKATAQTSVKSLHEKVVSQ